MTKHKKSRPGRSRQKNEDFEKIINYKFADLSLLQKALVHSSYAFERAQAGKNNERLEFLGDAVLDLVVGNILYQRFPNMKEGELTRLRSALVNESHLALMARQIKLGRFLYLGKGEDNSNGRNKPSILSCAYEAVIGAIFLDGGYDAVSKLVERFFAPVIQEKKDSLLLADAKSRLQEILQEKYNEGQSYILDGEEGPSHQKTFTISVVFRENVLGTGKAGSKKEAEQRAATAAIAKLLAQ